MNRLNKTLRPSLYSHLIKDKIKHIVGKSLTTCNQMSGINNYSYDDVLIGYMLGLATLE